MIVVHDFLFLLLLILFSCLGLAVETVSLALEDAVELTVAVDDAAGGGLFDAYNASSFGSRDSVFLDQLYKFEPHLTKVGVTSREYLL